ncbi:hypothetical protein F2P81_009998 [Scophthalmus maximus]|uniref:Uncharacterized protein n=1 Tax=Scophthalmus maximus TaxID=52904 RepID=A0A6A4T1J1_SCOMX|nr:hypothetical protein F2P81_009998 [Scophthalmus maximus]
MPPKITRKYEKTESGQKEELKVLRRRDGGDAGDRPKLRVDVTALHSDVECRRPGYLQLLCSSQVVARPRRVMARGFVSFVLN